MWAICTIRPTFWWFVPRSLSKIGYSFYLSVHSALNCTRIGKIVLDITNRILFFGCFIGLIEVNSLANSGVKVQFTFFWYDISLLVAHISHTNRFLVVHR